MKVNMFVYRFMIFLISNVIYNCCNETMVFKLRSSDGFEFELPLDAVQLSQKLFKELQVNGIGDMDIIEVNETASDVMAKIIEWATSPVENHKDDEQSEEEGDLDEKDNKDYDNLTFCQWDKQASPIDQVECADNADLLLGFNGLVKAAASEEVHQVFLSDIPEMDTEDLEDKEEEEVFSDFDYDLHDE